MEDFVSVRPLTPCKFWDPAVNVSDAVVTPSARHAEKARELKVATPDENVAVAPDKVPEDVVAVTTMLLSRVSKTFCPSSISMTIGGVTAELRPTEP